eukprot:759459-Hanusia_phi.AAC.2
MLADDLCGRADEEVDRTSDEKVAKRGLVVVHQLAEGQPALRGDLLDLREEQHVLACLLDAVKALDPREGHALLDVVRAEGDLLDDAENVGDDRVHVPRRVVDREEAERLGAGSLEFREGNLPIPVEVDEAEELLDKVCVALLPEEALHLLELEGGGLVQIDHVEHPLRPALHVLSHGRGELAVVLLEHLHMGPSNVFPKLLVQDP